MDFTICICTCGRTHLSETLRSLGSQTVPDGMSAEILVVDNAPGGPAQAIVEASRETSRLPIRLAPEPRRGLSNARNASLDAAAGTWLALIDDDETADPHWLLRLHETARLTGADAVIGTVLPSYACEPPAWLVESRMLERHLPPTGSAVGLGEALTGNALLSRDFVEREGLRFAPDFNTTGGEDSDFYARFIARGGRIVACREAVVREIVPPERMAPDYQARLALRKGETYAGVAVRNGGRLSPPALAVRASVNVAAAALLTLLCWLAGLGARHHYRMLMLRNLGKLRFLAGLPPIEMYKAASASKRSTQDVSATVMQ